MSECWMGGMTHELRGKGIYVEEVWAKNRRQFVIMRGIVSFV